MLSNIDPMEDSICSCLEEIPSPLLFILISSYILISSFITKKEIYKYKYFSKVL